MVETLSKSWCKKTFDMCSKEDEQNTSVFFTSKVFDSIEPILADWDELVGSSDLMFSSDYLSIIEKNPPQGITPFYVKSYDNKKLLAAFYFQYKFVRLEDNLRAIGNTQRNFSLKQFIKSQFIKSINFPTLVCGNLMVTGAYGFRFDKSVSKDDQKSLLLSATDAIVNHLRSQKINPGLIIIKDFEANHVVENFKVSDYTHFFVQPNMSLDIRPHWTSIEAYLFDLKSKYRVRYRKALQTTSHLIKKELSLDEIFNNQDTIFNLYKKISDQANFNSFILDKSYFYELKKNLADNLQLISYWDNDTMVGFYSTIKHECFLEAHFLGYDTNLNRETHLYLSMLYDMVDKAIKMKCQKINLSRTAIEIKSTVGAEPREMFILMKHTNKLINLFVNKIINWVNPKENYIIRTPFKD